MIGLAITEGDTMKLYTANELMSIYEEEKKTGYVSSQYDALKEWIETQYKNNVPENCAVVAFKRLI